MAIMIAIVDDLESDREKLRRDLEAFFNNTSHEIDCRLFSSAEAFLNSEFNAQIVFLDICMEGMNGVDLAKMLREKDEKLLIVFLSTSSDYAFDAFPVHPFDYLVKPYQKENLTRVLQETLRVMGVADPKVEIRFSRAAQQIPLRLIISAVAQGHSVEIAIIGSKPVRSIMRFSEVEALLCKDYRFLQCNRGVIVNMDHVLSLNGDVLLMKNGTSFSLRTRNRRELVAQFMQYQISRLKGGL